MKFIIAAAFALIVAVAAAPTSITGNNIGDIVTVGINADLKLNNTINQDIVAVLFALLNQQAIVALPNSDQNPEAKQPISPISVDMIKSLLTKQ